jgi:hypothetical protein
MLKNGGAEGGGRAAHWRLFRLDPKNVRCHLEAALVILMPLAAANRLDANRLTWIGQMENELSQL